jgi:hypothetical protein
MPLCVIVSIIFIDDHMPMEGFKVWEHYIVIYSGTNVCNVIGAAHKCRLNFCPTSEQSREIIVSNPVCAALDVLFFD